MLNQTEAILILKACLAACYNDLRQSGHISNKSRVIDEKDYQHALDIMSAALKATKDTEHAPE